MNLFTHLMAFGFGLCAAVLGLVLLVRSKCYGCIRGSRSAPSRFENACLGAGALGTLAAAGTLLFLVAGK